MPHRNTHTIDMDQVRRWYHEDGLSLRQIGTLTGSSAKTIERRMRAARIPRREPGTERICAGSTGAKAPKITPEEEKAIRAAFAEDPFLTFGEGVQRFGRANSTLRKIVGTGRRPWGRQLTADAYAIRGPYGRGLRGAEIDTALGWRPGRAAKIQRQIGLSNERPIPDAATLSRLYTQERSIEKVAQVLGLSDDRTREALAAAGIELGSARRFFGPGSRPGSRAYEIWQALGRHPEGLSTRRLAQVAYRIPVATQRELTWCGHILRELERRGHVTRAGYELGSYNNAPSIIWQLSVEAASKTSAA